MKICSSQYNEEGDMNQSVRLSAWNWMAVALDLNDHNATSCRVIAIRYEPIRHIGNFFYSGSHTTLHESQEKPFCRPYLLNEKYEPADFSRLLKALKHRTLKQLRSEAKGL